MLLKATLALSLTAGALAAPRAAAEDVRAIYTFSKATASASVKVYNADKSQYYGQSATNSSTVATGSFAQFPIAFDVDSVGYGSVSFGNATYLTRSKKKHSGGAVCHRIFNADEAEVDCWLPVPSGFSPTAVEEDEEDNVNEKRQLSGIIPCQPLGHTYLVGDGDPHQNYFHKQISETINCGAAPSCSAGYEQSESFSIGFSVSAEIDEWLTGGFDVQKTWETGNEYTCYGAEGDDVCIWYKTAHTAVTVYNILTLQAPCSNPMETISDNIILKSPNSNNRGGGYYCVIGTCRTKGDNYWDNSGPAGGPQ